MYGSGTADHGWRVRKWVGKDGSPVASTVLRDGRTYAVVGCVGETRDRASAEREAHALQREVAKQIALLVEWDARQRHRRTR